MLAIAALNETPEDPEALAVLAAIGLVTQEPEAARIVAVRSFKAARSEDEKFTAARLAARAAFDAGAPETAKFWLRRAVTHAPNEASRTVTIRDFQTVRRASRLNFDLNLAIRPSDNVNQGARDPMLTVDGRPTWFIFDGASLALSGIEAQASFGARYRLGGTPDAPTELDLRLYHRAVALSDSARASAPGASGAEFANSAVDLSLFHSLALGPDQTLRLGATLGRSWLGGDPYADRARSEAVLMTRHDDRTTTRLGFAVERQWLAGARPPATAFSVDAGVQRRLTSGDRIAFSLDLARTLSEDVNQENSRIGATLRYARAKSVAGLDLSGAIGLTARDYPVFFNGIFNDTGREDLTLSTSLDLAMPRLGTHGFEPVLSIEASRTRSNISRYDGQSLGIGLRIQSSF